MAQEALQGLARDTTSTSSVPKGSPKSPGPLGPRTNSPSLPVEGGTQDIRGRRGPGDLVEHEALALEHPDEFPKSLVDAIPRHPEDR